MHEIALKTVAALQQVGAEVELPEEPARLLAEELAALADAPLALREAIESLLALASRLAHRGASGGADAVLALAASGAGALSRHATELGADWFALAAERVGAEALARAVPEPGARARRPEEMRNRNKKPA
jgi:hypothetical protein